MDCYFMRMQPAVNAQTISEETIKFIAVKDDEHQNIMSSVALRKGVEEPWMIERVAEFIVSATEMVLNMLEPRQIQTD